MVVLGIDTATWVAAVGVARDGVVLHEAAERATASHAASLPVLVEGVLGAAGLTVEALDAVAVSIGPGSFTGLRIGLAFAKGIVFAGDLALAGVPTLEALAHAAEAEPGTTVCAALDARKREVYAATFEVTRDGGRQRLSPDEALSPEALLARLDPACLVVGDAGETYGELLRGRVRLLPFAACHPRGGVVARLGWQRLLAGEAINPGPAEPRYVRPPEAEIARQALR